MDEPFSALDIQTRQLMENELLELWAAKRKAVLFITHDLDEAIALTRPRGRALGRARRRIRSASSRSTCRGRATWPRSALTPRFVELHTRIWHAMKDEVLKGYAQHAATQPEAPLLRSGRLRAAGRGVRCSGTSLHAARRCCRRSSSTNPNQAAFFFGEPLKVLRPHLGLVRRPATIYAHLWVTLLETVLAFVIGTVLGARRRPLARARARPPRRCSIRTSRR